MKVYFVALLIFISASPAQARHQHRTELSVVERLAGAVAGFVRKAASAAAAIPASAATASVEAPTRLREAFYTDPSDEQVVPNPSGCPRTLFCGCGVSVRKYGRPVKELFAVASWRRFPRSSCAVGRVAVWSGHVAYILGCHADGTADLYDPNSGGGLTRIHRRELPSLIVDPPATL